MRPTLLVGLGYSSPKLLRPVATTAQTTRTWFFARKPTSTLKMTDLQKKLDAKIAGKKVVVISKSYCPFCRKAKAVIDKYNLSPEDLDWEEIENNPDCEAIQDYMKKITGGRSVPRVFINGKCIGGGDETVALDKSGQLAKMLK